jgi:hypothetical protein
MRQNPVLIGGCGRSGTSLLLSLLSAHPRIYAVPDETQAFCQGGYHPRLGPDQSVKIDRLYRHFVEADPPLESYARWCEKTPKNIQFVQRLTDYFGDDFRFLHIVRDGRDVVTSFLPGEPDKPWVSPERWVRDVQAGRAAEARAHVAAVRYEDLTRRLLPTMRRICDFLDEPFDERYFSNYPDSAQFGTGDIARQNTGMDFENEPVHTCSVGRWTQDDHASVVAHLMETEGAEELLQHYGYLDAA